MSQVLHILQEPLRADDAVFSGNDLRNRQLDEGIQAGGHSLSHAFLRKPGMAVSANSFANRDELQGLILRHKPDVILVAYWELLALLPFELTQPVVLDFVAPRPLEELFEQPQNVQASMARLRNALQRCDLVLCGNQRQADLLIPLLIEAGHDLRSAMPLRIVPLGAALAEQASSQPGPDGATLVMGGVSWPWRNEQPWVQALEQVAASLASPFRVMRFSGRYRLHEDKQTSAAADTASTVIQNSPLLPYAQYSEFLSQKAHAGVELADWNVERAFSQSFRSLDFLRHGLPLICNRYLPLARLVEQYDAGWLVDQPQDLAQVMRELSSDSALWRSKSAAAYRLAQEALSIQATTAELLDWLQQAGKSPRLPATSDSDHVPPVLGIPPLRERLQRQLGLARQVATARLFGQKKAGDSILFVTRGDIFPPDHGAAVRTVETARALGQQGLPVGIVTDDSRHWYEFVPDDSGKDEGGQGEFRQRAYPFWLRFVSLPAPLVKLLHYSKDLPQSNAFLYLPLTDCGFFWRILAAGKRIKAGILQAEFPAYAEPCLQARAALNSPVVLVEHNVEYRRLQAQISELSTDQYQRLRAIEVDLCQRSDAVVCVSDADRQILLDDGVAAQQLSTIPHGVHLNRYSADAHAEIRREMGVADADVLLVYHGTFSYPPNRQAIRVFAEELLPRLDTLGLHAHVLAVGRDAPASSPHERIHFSGSVADVAPWLKAADLAVIPLLEGGGTRMKIIDCFAARLAVISTAKGIEGIPIEPGKQALVIDDWQEMAEAIVDLKHNDTKRAALAASAFAMAAQLDWSEIARRYRALYSSLG
jgi:glycosyltransferase involved in cell wall biosynthesis